MKPYDYDCPIEAAFSVIGGKWKASIIYYLMSGNKRFNELHALLETASSRMLTRQLRELEGDEIISRTVYIGVPPKVIYSLTAYGETLIPVINQICCWGEDRLLRTGQKSVYN